MHVVIHCQVNDYEQYVTAGWNDIVEEKHVTAREAYLDWVFCWQTAAGSCVSVNAENPCNF